MIKIEASKRQRDWLLSSHAPGNACFTQASQERLREGFRPAWFRLVLKAKTQPAKDLIFNSNKSPWQLQVRQNTNINRVPMFATQTGNVELIIFRDAPLHHLEFSWAESENHLPSSEAAVFSLSIQRISTIKAWWMMLAKVASAEAKQGLPRSRIYRMTRARQKRGGMATALRKLVEAYQPLLSYQLIASDPYDYWLARENFQRATGLLAITLHTHFPQQLSHIDEQAWYIRLTEGDQLSPQAASGIAQFCAVQPDCLLLYSDHDRIDTYARRYAPSFKPDWNPELFLASDYVGPALFIKGTLLKHIQQHLQSPVTNRELQHIAIRGLIDMGTNPFTMKPDAVPIGHISEVLYHQHENNLAALNETGKNTQADVEQVSLTAKLAYAISPESVELAPSLGIHVKFPLPITSSLATPLVSIIVPTRDALDITRTCVESVLTQTSFQSFEVIIVNNDSAEPATLTWLKTIDTNPQVRVIDYPYPFNYSAINNFAVQQAQGEYICLLNNDTEVINQDWLTNMLRHAARPEIGCVGAKLYYHDDSIQHAGVVLGVWGLAGHSHKNFLRKDSGYLARLICEQSYSAVTAACLLVNKDIFTEVGGLNENELTVAFNDVDLCLKVRQAGYRNVWTPYAELYHYESKTRGSEDTPEKKTRELSEVIYMQRQWSEIIAHDPAYNVHLSRHSEDFNVSLVAVSSAPAKEQHATLLHKG